MRLPRCDISANRHGLERSTTNGCACSRVSILARAGTLMSGIAGRGRIMPNQLMESGLSEALSSGVRSPNSAACDRAGCAVRLLVSEEALGPHVAHDKPATTTGGARGLEGR